MIVKVVPYDPAWVQAFEKEAAILQDLLGPVLNAVHHIGSTSVPGLMAKPIIDIMLDVTDLGMLDAKNKEFEALGYEVMGEMGIPGRRYFRKGGDHRTHQIHAFQAGDSNLERHLAFRDYLIAHEEVARAYGALKYEIAQRAENDIETYWQAKDPFIKQHEALALAWYQNQ
jgi:GrpB-like predicted nucleotidyltransferase (UPF0157 family)